MSFKRSSKLNPLIPLLLLIPLSSFAEAPASLTLDEALNEARSHSPQLAMARAQVDASSWHRLEAASTNLPQLSASATHFLDYKYQLMTIPFGGAIVNFPAIYPLTTLNLDASWTVFDGLKTPFAVMAAEAGKIAADHDLKRAELVLDGEIRDKFYAALAAQVLADVAAQNVKTLHEHLTRTQELLNRGKATRFDTLRVETQLAEAEPEQAQANDDVAISRRELAITMGLDADDRPLVGELPEPVSPAAAEKPISTELEARDDIQALEAHANAASKAFDSSIGGWIPKVTFTAEKQWYDNIDKSTSFSNPPYNDAYSVGVFLSWNIFDGGATLARIKEAVAAREKADAQLTLAQLKAPQEIDTSRRRLLHDVALYQARKHAIATAEESVRLAKLGYSAGTRTSTDMLDATLDLFRAKAGLVRAQLDAVRAQTNLELAVGHRL